MSLHFPLFIPWFLRHRLGAQAAAEGIRRRALGDLERQLAVAIGRRPRPGKPSQEHRAGNMKKRSSGDLRAGIRREGGERVMLTKQLTTRSLN